MLLLMSSWMLNRSNNIIGIKKLLILFLLILFLGCEKDSKYFFIGNWTVDFSSSPTLASKGSGWFVSFTVSDINEGKLTIDTSYLSTVLNNGATVCYDWDYAKYCFVDIRYNHIDLSLQVDLSVNSVQHHVFIGEYDWISDKFFGESYYYETARPDDLRLWSSRDSTYRGLMYCN